MTPDEKRRKKEARKLINTPVSERPDNVHYRPGTRLNYASYMVELEGVGIYFQYDGKRMYYLGEYPPENFQL